MVEKKYCEYCKKDISTSNWSKHLTAKIHEKNVKQFENPTTLTETETNESLLTQSPSPKHTISDDIIDRIEKVPNVIVTQKFKKVTLKARINLEAKNIERYYLTLSDIIHQIDKFHYKICIAANVELRNNNNENVTHVIKPPMEPIISTDQALEVIHSQLNYAQVQISERYMDGSGLSLQRINYVDFWLSAYKKNKGGHFVELPFKTKTVINVKSEDSHVSR